MDSFYESMKVADYEIAYGDYVVLDRYDFEDFVIEEIMTFSDIYIKRRREKNADYATPGRKTKKISRKDFKTEVTEYSKGQDFC